ncbi:hypothetical protein NC651_021385 [Populus alba x Populus x berolinensis]|nr:hypothetical protein NC651_021385 [Populus alba x Populus x berolinensis]
MQGVAFKFSSSWHGMVVYLSGQMRIFAHSPKQHTFSQCQGTPQDLGERVLDFERRDFLALLLK